MFVLVTVLVGFYCLCHYVFPSAGALLIDNNLTDRQPSVTVTINKYCFEAFYIVTVRFGKSKESDIDSCDYRQTEKASLMPADGKEFHVNTTLIKLNDNDNEMYCFNATLEEVSCEFISAVQVILLCVLLLMSEYAPCSHRHSTNSHRGWPGPTCHSWHCSCCHCPHLWCDYWYHNCLPDLP